MTFEKQVLARIKAEKVIPTSRGYFKLRESVTGGALVLSVGALGVGFGMIMSSLSNFDLAVISQLEMTMAERIFASIPFFWILASLALGALSYINFRRTRRGYKMETRQLALTFTLFAVAIGSLALIFNFTNYIGKAVSNVPIYSSVNPIDTNNWFDPERGIISGVVRDRNSNEDFKLRDAEHNLWSIVGENITIPPNWSFHPGDRIRIIGTKTGDFEFTAREIHPWTD